MKNYIIKSNGYNHPMDYVNDALDNFFKPLFYDEKLDSMKTDIREIDNGYQLDIEMPGYEKSDIDISIEDGYLTVSAHKKSKEETDAKQRYLRKERSISCQRSYYVSDIKEADVKATYTNGILSITVPKDEPAPPQKHNIAID